MATNEYKPGDLPYPEQDERKLFCKFHYKGVLIVLIPLLFAPILLGPQVLVYRFLYLTACIYTYLICNVMPPGVIAFIYIVFLPLCGIAGSKAVSMAHYTDLIFLTFGSVFMGIMMDVSKLSDRLALFTLKICGPNIICLQAYLMIMTAISSIFVNGTVMTAFWMKVAQAVMLVYDEAGIVRKDSDEETYEHGATPYPSRQAVGIYLTICYAATFGGMMSPFQDPNGAAVELFNYYMGKGTSDSGSFPLIFVGPFILGLLVLFLWINIMFLGLVTGRLKANIENGPANKEQLAKIMNAKRDALGPWSMHTKLACILVGITFISLFTRRPLIFPGWDDLIKKTQSGASVAIIGMSILFFALPANYMFCKYYMCRRPEKEGTVPSVLGWKPVNANTPWGNIFMLASSFGCLFAGQQSNAYALLRDTLVRKSLGRWDGLIYASLIGTILTILSPATGVCKVVLPYMMEVGFKGSNGPGIVGAPFVTIVHNQFLLPTSTPPNTIVAGWGNLRAFQFLLGGSVPTIAMLLFIPLFTNFLGESAFPGYMDTNFNTTFTFTTFKPV
ncbi:uncharacterized protein Dwil_GK15228 [Drosophila willistoni]|uniref:Citrate transporter-like domain-containing protein n=1 Tax=Drosophila willistoni TaxID=7260 RepID=B4MWB2_DROWI|nr:protein I'm not dead yet [Drosophila willistoni]EDW75982.1 uncharacterized protein Dwil_GK15228 [Drosophila willistoni]